MDEEEEQDRGRWHEISMRLSGDNLPETDEISARLQLPTSYGGRKDRHFRDNPRYAKYRQNFWGWNFTTDNRVPFEEQFCQLFDQLNSRRDALAELLAIPGIEAEWVLGYSSVSGQGGMNLSSEMLARLAELRFSLSIHLYPPGDFEAE